MEAAEAQPPYFEKAQSLSQPTWKNNTVVNCLRSEIPGLLQSLQPICKCVKYLFISKAISHAAVSNNSPSTQAKY